MEKLKEKIPGTEEHKEHKEGKKSGSDSDLSDSEKDTDNKDTVNNKDTVKDTAGRERDSNIRDKTMKDADPHAGRYKDGGSSVQSKDGTPDNTTLSSGRTAVEPSLNKDQGKAPISNQQPIQDQTKQPIEGQSKHSIQDQSKHPSQQSQSKQQPISDSKAKIKATDDFFGELANLRSEISKGDLTVNDYSSNPRSDTVHKDTNQIRGDVARDDVRSDRDRSDISKADKAAHLSNKDDISKDTSRIDTLHSTKQPVV